MNSSNGGAIDEGARAKDAPATAEPESVIPQALRGVSAAGVGTDKSDRNVGGGAGVIEPAPASSPLRERRPKGAAWTEEPIPPLVRARLNAFEVSSWRSKRIRVISALADAELPDRSGIGPQWHVSVAVKGGRGTVNDAELLRVRRAFGMLEAEEDNHEPGKARHLWLAVDPAHRVDCECKADEVTVVEPDGHRWQAPPEEIDNRRALMARTWGPR